jgi:hypothetical protein
MMKRMRRNERVDLAGLNVFAMLGAREFSVQRDIEVSSVLIGECSQDGCVYIGLSNQRRLRCPVRDGPS